MMVEFIKLYEDDKRVDYFYRTGTSKDQGIVRFDKESLEYEIIEEDDGVGPYVNRYYCNHIKDSLREWKNKCKPFPKRCFCTLTKS